MRIVSFCSGALGMDLGFEQAGFEPVCYNDIYPQAIEVMRANRPNVPIFNQPIGQVSINEIKRLLNGEQPFAVIGGPPCQSFSTNGKRRGFDSFQGTVMFDFIEIAGRLSPKYIVIENVRGLASTNFGEVPALTYIKAELMKFGYSVSYNLYDTSLYGVPQKRERIVIIASNRHTVSYMVPSQEPVHTLRDAISGIESPEGSYEDIRPQYRKFFEHIGPGQNWQHLPEFLKADAYAIYGNKTGGHIGFLRRLSYDAPSPTVLCTPMGRCTMLVHPEHDRSLSTTEYAAIQTFPRNWLFPVSRAHKYKLIGNAVPVRFANRIARHLLWDDAIMTTMALGQFSRYKGINDLSI